MRFVLAQGSNRATAHSKAFAEQTHENRGRVPRFSYFKREKVSVWELSDVRVLRSQNTDCRKNDSFSTVSGAIRRDGTFVSCETKGMEQMTKLFHVKHRRGTGRDCFTWNLFRAVYVPRETTYTLANSCFTWNIFRRRKRAGKNFGIVPLFSFKHVL